MTCNWSSRSLPIAAVLREMEPVYPALLCLWYALQAILINHFWTFVSDYFDFSIYIDALEADIENWYVNRFLSLCDSVFQDPNSFFRHFAQLSREDAITTARTIWKGINGLNLKENIEPTRDRASLILRKGEDHRVSEVRLRKL